MDKERIMTFGLENFKATKELLDYYDENVIVIKGKNMPESFKGSIRIDCFLIIYCFQGEISININQKDYMINKDNSAVVLPNSVISRVRPSIRRINTYNNVSIIGFSTTFLKDIIQFKKETWDIIYRLYQNPILPSAPQTSYKFYLYKEMAYTLNNEQPHSYRNEILKHFFAAIFCEILSEICKVIPQKHTKIIHDSNRASWIFRKFIELVMKDDGTHRTVTYYADKLCYSPKHLSTIVKQVCGRSPLKIINEHAIEKIKYQLQNTDKSMKELTDEFNFANPSFFGKFVKQHLGVSPQQYRNMPKEKV